MSHTNNPNSQAGFTQNQNEHYNTMGSLDNNRSMLHNNHTANNTGDFNNALQLTGTDIPSLNHQLQQMNWLQSQYNHYKKKAKKLDKRNQKLQIDKHDLSKQLSDTQNKMNELTEKQRDLRQKFQIKLQEKNMKISELKQQIIALQQGVLMRGDNLQLNQLRSIFQNELSTRVHANNTAAASNSVLDDTTSYQNINLLQQQQPHLQHQQQSHLPNQFQTNKNHNQWPSLNMTQQVSNRAEASHPPSTFANRQSNSRQHTSIDSYAHLDHGSNQRRQSRQGAEDEKQQPIYAQMLSPVSSSSDNDDMLSQ